MIRRYPPKARLIDYQKGVNFVDTVLKNDFAQKLENFEYVTGTLRRRAPFVAKSTVNFNVAANFGSGIETPGEFTGRHEYVDNTDTSRILHAHTNGTIKEFVSSSSSVNRVSGLTAGQKIRFENFMGGAVSVNGADTPRRADGTTWRVFGAPAPIIQAAATLGAGALTMTRKAIVVACIRVSGVVVVRSDWSNIITAVPAAQGITWNWAASSDSRVDYYQVYVTQNALSGPYFLLGGTTGTSLADNTADASLSETQADSNLRDGVAPIAKMIASAGQRIFMGGLIDATDPDADKTVHASAFSINKYEIEYFPQDGIHRFKLLGAGPITACIGMGVKDESDNANDAFFSQKDSCYILRGGDPFSNLETVSRQVGAINPDAVAQWKRYFFFISTQGLEFLGSTGSPINICRYVKPFFVGGGELNLGGISGEQYVYLTVDNYKNQLLINIRDDSSKRWGNVTLILDLEQFNPNAPTQASVYSANSDQGAQGVQSARFTTFTGPGMAFYLSLRDRSLILFDNQNYRMLQRGSGATDTIAGVATQINAISWSGALLGEFVDSRKKLTGINVIAISDSDTSLIIENDGGQSTYPVTQIVATRSWDKVWDKTWYVSQFYQASISVNVIGGYFQFKHTVNVSSASYSLIGFILYYTQIMSKILGRR